MIEPVVLKTGHQHADTVAAAFAEGLGTKPQHVQEYIEQNRSAKGYLSPDQNSLPIFYGILRGTGDVAMSLMLARPGLKRGSFIYIDHGYMAPGHYDGYYRCIWNGLHARPTWREDKERLAKVWSGQKQRVIQLKNLPQRASGHIVVVPPTDYVGSFWGFSPEAWLKTVLDLLPQYTDRPIYVSRKGKDTPAEELLPGAHALVTVQSNVIIPALLLDVRVCILPPVVNGHYVDWWHPAEQISYLGVKDIETPNPANQRDVIGLLAKLAACQFTLDEMKRGEAWKWIKQNIVLKDGQDSL